MKKNFLSLPTIITGRKSRRAPGDFTNSQLNDILLKAEVMWTDGAQANVYKSHADSAKAVLENQTARFQELADKDKDNKVRVNWINPCAMVDEACESNCTITAAELETGVKEYEFDMCRKVDFSINREKLRTSIYDRDELAAIGMAKAIKTLDEWWNTQMLLKLKSFSGVNVAPSPWTFSDADMTTQVPSAQYNLAMVAILKKQAMLNQMNSPFYIEKGDLYVPVLNAEINGGNAEGKGDAARAKYLDLYFDLFGFEKAGITEDLFAIDRSAVAMRTYNRYPDTPTEMGGKVAQTQYSVASQLLPGVRYGVIYEFTCVTNGSKTEYHDAWRVITEGGIWLNPEACPVEIGEETYTPTGVMSYSKTA